MANNDSFVKSLAYFVICISIITPALSFACKSPDYSYWLSLSDKELQQHGCVRDQLFMALYSFDGRTEKTVTLGKMLRRKGIFNIDSIKLEADALYKTKQYEEALKVYLLSQSADNKCEAKSTCGKWEYSDAIEHYLLYKYYRAANHINSANIELKKGDIEFEKACRLESSHPEYCQNLKPNLFQMLGV